MKFALTESKKVKVLYLLILFISFNTYAQRSVRIGYIDTEYILQNGIDSSVVESHREFTDETQHRTTGASVETVRDDPNDIVPWIGLRRPDYHGVFADKDARVTHSEDPRQMSSAGKYCGLF